MYHCNVIIYPQSLSQLTTREPLCYFSATHPPDHYWAQSEASDKYCKHFSARFDGVHAFGYNSTESEPIWMKFGALLLHYLRLVLADFGRDLRSCVAEEGGEILFFVR